MSARAAALALTLALALFLCAGETAAQTAVCSDTPGANQSIECLAASGSAQDITIDARNLSITISSSNPFDGVYANHEGTGGVSIKLTGGQISTASYASAGVHGRIANTASEADVSITLENGARIETAGTSATGAYGLNRGSGGVSINLSDARVETSGAGAHGVWGHDQGASGRLSINLNNAVLSTTGAGSYGVYGLHQGAGAIAVDMAGGSIETAEASTHGVFAWMQNAASGAAISIGIGSGARIKTAGAGAIGVWIYHQGAGAIAVDMPGGSIETAGARAYGVLAWMQNAASEADVSITLENGARIKTGGASAIGAYGLHYGSGGVSISLSDARVETAGAGAIGVWGYIRNAANEADVSIGAAGGSVSAEGLGARGLYGLHTGLGSVSMTTGADVKAPFYIGAEGRLTNDANAAGRILITHEGAIEARDLGVLASALRSSGHAMGDGAQTADDAARTEPMVHVVSSGDVTVGEGVMDDFIRGRIAGEDGALSTDEQAVLSAITGGDSDALDTALGALPASYDDDYKAEARELLRKRGAAPTSAAALASLAAGEILGLSRAGVRALALSRTAIADHVRGGDQDPTILAIDEASRTEEQTAALAEQSLLSAAERTVLEAALTGGDLETALAALPAAYADDWKDGVRRRAASYNAGDIRVDVTGGSVTAEGNGVEALYAVPHERNGAISVSVAEGAEVTGGVNGLYLAGAGEGEGNFLAQSVSIDGRVTGGSGAGVYMKGGGRLSIGATGAVGASSGVGVLADGAGDLIATVAGMVEGDVRNESGDLSVSIAGMVTGDVRSLGGDLTATVSGTVDGNVEGLGEGDHTVTVFRGGVVTGTIHLAASAVAVDGAVGGVRLDRGGTVEVGPSGRLTGVNGVAVRAGGAALLVDLNPSGRRFSSVAGGGVIIHNAGGKTTILVNGVKLHDGETGETGAEIPNGPRVVSLLAGAGEDGIFTAEEFIESGLHQGIYEALPGMLLRMESGRTRSARTTAPGSPVWARLSGGRGSRGAKRSDSAAKYDFDSMGLEAGLNISFPWTSGLSGAVSLRHRKGAAEISLPSDKGKIDLAGAGAALGLSWRSRSGWRVNGDFSVMEYDADISSKKLDKLRGGAGVRVSVLDVEAGRRFAFEKLALAPRVWLTRSMVSMDSFTDSTGARFSLVRANRLAGGFGAAAETARPLEAGGGTLALRGSLDLESVLSGEKTSVEVSGDRFHAEAASPRLLLSLGARWRMGRFTLDAALSSSGLGSDDKTLGARLSLGARF